jgi:hypothetical protein
MLRSVAPTCAGRMEPKHECAECAQGAKRRGTKSLAVDSME